MKAALLFSETCAKRISFLDVVFPCNNTQHKRPTTSLALSVPTLILGLSNMLDKPRIKVDKRPSLNSLITLLKRLHMLHDPWGKSGLVGARFGDRVWCEPR